MRTSMTAQQTAFFTQNGYIEVAGLSFDPKEMFALAKDAALAQPFGRDLWRKNKTLEHLLLRKLAPAIFHLNIKPVRLAFDQWKPSFDRPRPIKDLFCVQGLSLCALFVDSEIPPPTRRLAAPGILPFPSHPENVLFVKPQILLDWPLLSADLYLAAYSLPNQSVYVSNPNDPGTYLLKQFGYEFGDTLIDPHNPLLKLP